MPLGPNINPLDQLYEEMRGNVAALREGEAFNQAVLSSLTEHLAVLDMAGNIIAVNDAWARFARENGCETLTRVGLGLNYLDVCRNATGAFADEAQEALAGLQAVLNGTRSAYSLEYTCHSETEHRWFLMNVTPLMAGQGGVVVSHHDITKRRQAEIALQESQNGLLAIIASAVDAIITVDAHQRITVFNAAAAQMFGCSVEEVIGQPLDRFIPERFRAAYPRHIEAFGNTHGAIYGVRSNGEEFQIEASISQVESDEHKFTTVILRDITERSQTQAKLIEQAALLNQARNAIVSCDLEGRVLFWNRGAEQIHGWTAAEVIGRNINEVYNDHGVEAERAARELREKGGWTRELRLLTKAGREIVVESHCTVTSDDDGQPTGFLVINNDITEGKKVEAQFLRAQRLESIGTLASGLAHDLNNILSPITMGIQLLQMKSNDEGAQHLLEMIMQSTQRGAHLIKQVLSFARGSDANKTVLQPNHLIRDIIKILQETLPKEIDVKQWLAAELATIEGDPTQLHQVLMNLCINARDAMPQGGTLSISAENIFFDEEYAAMFHDGKLGAYVMITVADTGTGICQEILDRIFDPFFTTKEPGQGTGLGLSTALGIVKSHGGLINVTSEAGKGARFILYFPASSSSQPAQAPEAMSKLPSGRGETILVVDDERHVREITRMTLEAFGYRVLLASEGAEGVSVYAAHQKEVAAILSDMMMPVMDGPAMIRALQRINPQVKIVAISGLADSSRSAEALSLGIKALLPKPCTAESLLVTLDKLLG